MQDWVTPLSPFLKRGFKNYSRKVYGANAAKSLIHWKALHRQGYNSTIDPSLVKVSAGKVALPEALQAGSGADGQVHFSWAPNTEGNASPRDRIMLLAYNVEKKWPDYELSGPKRHEAVAQLALLGNIPGAYHLYAAFVSEDGEEQSDSVYLGSLQKMKTSPNVRPGPTGGKPAVDESAGSGSWCTGVGNSGLFFLMRLQPVNPNSHIHL